ncbi:hypothetical protein BKA58DRAFT_165121 [Alternaria rosae]|uniref:uncharacterized protein n=1 Tax=Alternaria rosae TaxID=1187941 RepID=UPI001E8CA6AA|nr:uncharacterized protein BKA58DRAFT_165121 [Alternaria rosae]KAH6873334.1 hypothetical protein BKA58DRAFT_165121 [Alternaria rosae]
MSSEFRGRSFCFAVNILSSFASSEDCNGLLSQNRVCNTYFPPTCAFFGVTWRPCSVGSARVWPHETVFTGWLVSDGLGLLKVGG